MFCFLLSQGWEVSLEYGNSHQYCWENFLSSNTLKVRPGLSDSLFFSLTHTHTLSLPLLLSLSPSIYLSTYLSFYLPTYFFSFVCITLSPSFPPLCLILSHFLKKLQYIILSDLLIILSVSKSMQDPPNSVLGNLKKYCRKSLLFFTINWTTSYDFILLDTSNY